MIPINPKTITIFFMSTNASGANGIIHLIIPYNAIFNINADKSIVPAIGATVYVDGCHVWKGTNGILIANARKNPDIIQNAAFDDNWTATRLSWEKSLVYVPNAINDRSIAKDYYKLWFDL